MFDPHDGWSEGMTRISDVVCTEKQLIVIREDDTEIDKSEILKLEKLVKQLKIKTIVGKVNLDGIAEKVTADEKDLKYDQLQLRFCELLDEMDQLEKKLKKSEDARKQVQEKLEESIKMENIARKENDDLKNLQKHLEIFYRGKNKQKTQENSKNQIKELNRLNLESCKKDKNIMELKDDLRDAKRKIQEQKREINNILDYNQYQRIQSFQTNNPQFMNHRGYQDQNFNLFVNHQAYQDQNVDFAYHYGNYLNYQQIFSSPHYQNSRVSYPYPNGYSGMVGMQHPNDYFRPGYQNSGNSSQFQNRYSGLQHQNIPYWQRLQNQKYKNRTEHYRY